MTRVHTIQQRLTANGFSPGPIDGVQGPMTRRAVRQFQAANNLKVDGIVGDKTWAALMAGPQVSTPDELLIEERSLLRKLVSSDVSVPVRQVLDAALTTLGWREDPDGSNGGANVSRMSKGYFSDEDEQRYGLPPWCALAVSYWLREGLEVTSYQAIPFGARFGAVAQIEDWARDNDRFTVARASTAAPSGAIFTMSRARSGSDIATAVRSGHTGLVIADDGRFIVTIEGNTSNAVRSRRRRKTTLRGWATWW